MTLSPALPAAPGHRLWRDHLLWAALALAALVVYLPYSQPLFASLFPALERPVYQQEPFCLFALAALQAGRYF